MTTEKKQGKFFYGWIIVVACTLLSATSTGLLSYFNALFVAPVTQSLNLNRSSFMLFSTLSTVTTMILMPVMGVLFRKYSLKLLILVGATLGACAHLTYSLSSGLVGFYLGGIMAGTAICLYGATPMTILLANWFHAKRGTVTGIAFIGSSMVSSLFSPAMSNLIATQGWRTGYRVIALSIFVLTTLTVLFVIKIKPSDIGQQPYGITAAQANDVPKEKIGLMRKDAIRTPAFWLFGVSIFIMGMVTVGTQQQLVAYWSGSGAGTATAAQMYSIVMFVGIFAKIFLGGMFDKFGVRLTTIFCCSIAIAAMISLIAFTSGYLLIIPAVLFGITTAVQVMSSTYLTNKFFGEKDYGSNFGLINTMLFLGVSFGIPFSAFIYDVSGGYQLAWATFGTLILIAMFALLAADKMSQKAYKSILGIERGA